MNKTKKIGHENSLGLFFDKKSVPAIVLEQSAWHTNGRTHARTHTRTHTPTHTQTAFHNLPFRATAQREIIRYYTTSVKQFNWYNAHCTVLQDSSSNFTRQHHVLLQNIEKYLLMHRGLISGTYANVGMTALRVKSLIDAENANWFFTLCEALL